MQRESHPLILLIGQSAAPTGLRFVPSCKPTVETVGYDLSSLRDSKYTDANRARQPKMNFGSNSRPWRFNRSRNSSSKLNFR